MADELEGLSASESGLLDEASRAGGGHDQALAAVESGLPPLSH